MRVCLRFVFALASLLFAAARAQAAASGAITGRVFNPATQEYMRNADLTLTAGGLFAQQHELRAVPARLLRQRN
jgi:hypothetical protein